MGLITLKRRSDFLRLRGGARWVAPAFILETRPRKPKDVTVSSSAPGSSDRAKLRQSSPERGEVVAPQFGFTVTRRIGKAVTRNLIRRRFKEAVRALAADHAKPDHDYVLIARSGAQERSFALIVTDLKTAFERVHRRPRRRRS